MRRTNRIAKMHNRVNVAGNRSVNISSIDMGRNRYITLPRSGSNRSQKLRAQCRSHADNVGYWRCGKSRVSSIVNHLFTLDIQTSFFSL